MESENAAAAQSKGTLKASARARRRANTANSEVPLAFDANGQQKPAYRQAKAAQKCGPQVNRVGSMEGASGLRNRSMDDLFGAGTAGVSAASAAGSGNGEGASQAAQRRAKSEAASPLMDGSSSSFAQLNGQLPPLDLSGIKFPPYIPNSADFFGTWSDFEQPMFSAGLSATSVDWSNYDGLELAGKTADFAPSSYSQAPSYCGFDFTGSEQVPTMTTTTSTSGEVSEVEDFLSSAFDEFDTFQSTAPTGGYPLGHSHAGLFGGNTADLGNLEFDDFNQMKKTGNKFLPTPSSLPSDDPTLLTSSAPSFDGLPALEDHAALWMNDYGMPNLTDSPTESNMPSFWDGQ